MDAQDYSGENVTIASGEGVLNLTDGIWIDTDYSDFMGGSLDPNTTVSTDGYVTLLGDNADLIGNGNLSSGFDWNFMDSPDGNVTSEWTGASGRLAHASPHQAQFDDMDSAVSDMRWWPIGTSAPVLTDDMANMAEGESSLKLVWNPNGDSTRVAGIYRDEPTPWDWSGYNRIKLWIVSDPGPVSVNISVTLYNSTEAWSPQTQTVSIDTSWADNDFDFYISSAFSGDLSVIDRLELNFSGVTAITSLLVDNITLFNQMSDMDGSGLSRWWSHGSVRASLDNDMTSKIEGSASLSVTWNPEGDPDNWVSVFRDEPGFWDWSEYSHVKIYAVKGFGVGNANISVFLYNMTSEWKSPALPISGPWGAYEFDISIADLASVDRLGILINGSAATNDVTVWLDDVTLLFKYDDMEPVNEWGALGTAPILGISLDPNIFYEGSTSLNLTFMPSVSTQWANISRSNGLDWSPYDYLTLWARTNITTPGLKMTLSLMDSIGKWCSSQQDIGQTWTMYSFDLANVIGVDLSSLTRVELNFTGVAEQTSVYVDILELYTQSDGLDDAWQSSYWQPWGNAPPSLSNEQADRLEGAGSLKLWWNPLSDPGNWATVFCNYTGSISTFNRMELWTKAVSPGPDLNMSLSLYGNSMRWDSQPLNVIAGWSEYVFDIGSVPGPISGSITKVELNFTGVDVITTVYIDDIRLNAYKEFDQTGFANQTFSKANVTDAAPTHVILNFDYAVLNQTPHLVQEFGVRIDGIGVWTKVLDAVTQWSHVYIDLSQYMTAAKSYEISFYLRLGIDTPFELDYSVEFDNVSIIAPDYSNATFESREYDAGSVAIWNTVDWSEMLESGTDIILQLRHGNSSLELQSAAWSQPLTDPASTSIKGYNYSMIQYRLNLTTTNATLKPTFHGLNLSFQKYIASGKIETGDLDPPGNIGWLTFGAVALEPMGTSVSYSYSNDSGQNWTPILPGADLSPIPIMPIRLRADLFATDTSQTPVLQELNLTFRYYVNQPPVIIGTIPDQTGIEDNGTWNLDLASYASDDSPNSDLKWFVAGSNESLYRITGENVTGNHILAFTPLDDAWGNDRATLWLEDPLGLTVSQDIWINITPVNDPPTFSAPPDLFVMADEDYSFDYSSFISDIDNVLGELSLTVDDNHGSVSGLIIIYRYPTSSGNKGYDVLLTLSDGNSEVNATITINVISPGIIGGWGWDSITLMNLGWLGLLALLFAFFILIPILRSRKKRFTVEDIFLTHRDGRLIAHYTRELRPDRDEDILAGMLTAVQEFIKDSMGKQEVLKRFEFEMQDKRVLVQSGENVYIAIFTSGEVPSSAQDEMRVFLEDLEQAYADVIPDWSGDPEAFKGLKDLMDMLLVGRGYKEGQWKKLKFLEGNHQPGEMTAEQKEEKKETEKVDKEIDKFLDELEQLKEETD
jgi:hypothetical protein